MTLHDQTRRVISLLLFFILGPLLTFGILGMIVSRKIPSNARNFEYKAAVQTGLTWKIGAVEYRSPQCTRLKKVRIIDDVSAKEIFLASEMDIQFIPGERLDKIFPGIDSTAEVSGDPVTTVTQYIKPSGFWQISISDSVLMFDDYTAGASEIVVRNLFAKILARFSLLSETPVQISFENVGVFSDYSKKKPKEKPDHLQFVRGNLYRTKTEIRSDWEFRAPEFSEFESQKLSIVRPHHSSTIEISLRTGDKHLPCEFAAVFCSAFQRFGSGSRFSGEFATEYKEDSGDMTVRMKNVCFKNLQLASFVRDYTPFGVSGTINDLQIQNATFGSKDFMANGCLLISNGEVEEMLFRRFVERFNLVINPPDFLDSPRKTIPFTACAIHFQLRPDGVTFSPDELWKDAFMQKISDDSRTHEMVVYFPEGNRQQVSYHTVLSIFAPDTAPVVPLTSGLKELFSLIPVDGNLKPAVVSERKTVSPLPASLSAESQPMFATPINIKPTPDVMSIDPGGKL